MSDTEQMIKQAMIYVIGGQKGGVGKSSFCQAFCQYRINSKQSDNTKLIEGDAQVDDVGRVYGSQFDSEKVVISDDPAKASNPDTIYQSALKSQKDVIVNLPSNILDHFTGWLEQGQILDILKDRLDGKIRLVKFFVSDGCYESILQFKKSIEMLDNAVPHVLILNLGRVSAADFSYLDDQALYTEIRNNAPNLIGTFTMPRMEPSTRFFIDKLGEGIGGAYEQSEDDLNYITAQRIKNFMDETTEMFEGIDQAVNEWFTKSDDWSDWWESHTDLAENVEANQQVNGRSQHETPEQKETVEAETRA